MVVTTLLYACESWAVHSRHTRQLNHFHTNCLRRLLNVKWQERIPDTDVLSRANLPSVYALLQKAQARWAMHVLCMEDKGIPKFFLYGELVERRRQVGRPKLHFKDNLKTTLKSLEISTETWQTLASDRPTWCSPINKRVKSVEQRRKAVAEILEQHGKHEQLALLASRPPARSVQHVADSSVPRLVLSAISGNL